jgi:hypothetical protein
LVSIAGALSLSDLSRQLENYLVNQYLVSPYSTTGQAPQTRWEASGFLPQMPDSLEKLDLLLLTVPKTRRVRPDGIHFLGMRCIDPTLAAYGPPGVGKPTLRGGMPLGTGCRASTQTQIRTRTDSSTTSKSPESSQTKHPPKMLNGPS